MSSAKKNKSKRAALSLYRLGLVIVLGLLMHTWPPAVNAASSTVNVEVCYPTAIEPTLITPPADATVQNSSIIMSGIAPANTAVYAFRNAVQVGFVTSAPDGSFSLSISLNIGNNVLHAAIKDECDEFVDSTSVTIHREAAPSNPSDPAPSPTTPETPGTVPGTSVTTPPKPTTPTNRPSAILPTITEPRNGGRFTSQNISVTGSSSSPTMVRIFLNNRLVAEVLSDDKGAFSVSITLEPGENHLFASSGTVSSELKSPVVTVYFDSATPSTPTTSSMTLLITLTVIVGGLWIYLLLWQRDRLRRFFLAIRKNPG